MLGKVTAGRKTSYFPHAAGRERGEECCLPSEVVLPNEINRQEQIKWVAELPLLAEMSLSFVLVVTSKFSYWFSIDCFQRRQFWLWGHIQGPGQVVFRRFETLTLLFLRYWLCKSSPLCLPACLSGVVAEGHGNIDVWRVNGRCESGGMWNYITNSPQWLISSHKSLTGRRSIFCWERSHVGTPRSNKKKCRLTFHQERHLGFSHHVRETCMTRNSTFSPTVVLSLHLSLFSLSLFDLIYNLFLTPQTYHCVLFTDCLLCFSSLVQHHPWRAPAVIYA